jgi:hypothetical protein
VRPVDLGLLAGEGLEPKVCLGLGLGPHRRHVVAQRAQRALVAALAEHVVQPGGPQRRVLLQRLADELLERLDQRRPAHRVATGLLEAERALDDVGVDAELRRDRADRPVLAVVQPHDIDIRLLGHRHRPPPRLRVATSNLPARCTPPAQRTNSHEQRPPTAERTAHLGARQPHRADWIRRRR